MVFFLLSLLLLPTGHRFGDASALRADEPVAARAWDGQRRVVHEWGTFVTVAGSDGRTLGGLTHDPFDLPPFVYDLLDRVALTGLSPKMETPVIYFYSPEPWTIRVRVGFPRGLLTQWYPAPTQANLHSSAGGPAHVNLSQPCELSGGSLDWGRFGELRVLARSQDLDVCSNEGRASSLACFPEVEDHDPWSYSRQVAANAIGVTNYSHVPAEGEDFCVKEEYERFLFYRGLGNFELPLIARLKREQWDEERVQLELLLENRDESTKLRHLFLIVVHEGRVAFRALADLQGSAHYERLELPWLPKEHGVGEIPQAIAQALHQTGLYWDEALAMVHTWQNSWLGEEGVRLLYFLPEHLIQRELPLSVEGYLLPGKEGLLVPQPAPDEILRTFVARIEMLSPEREAQILAVVRGLRSSVASERASAELAMSGWQRYQAPYLERAQALGEAPPEVFAGAQTR